MLGTKTLTPTPDRHEHGKQNRPLVVNHVSDLEKIKEERDGGSEVQGLWHLRVWGEASAVSGPLATLVPPETGKDAAGGQNAGKGWTLGLVSGKLFLGGDGDRDLAIPQRLVEVSCML